MGKNVALYSIQVYFDTLNFFSGFFFLSVLIGCLVITTKGVERNVLFCCIIVELRDCLFCRFSIMPFCLFVFFSRLVVYANLSCFQNVQRQFKKIKQKIIKQKKQNYKKVRSTSKNKTMSPTYETES